MTATAFLEVVAINDSDYRLYLANDQSLARILFKPSPNLKSLKFRFLMYTKIRD